MFLLQLYCNRRNEFEVVNLLRQTINKYICFRILKHLGTFRLNILHQTMFWCLSFPRLVPFLLKIIPRAGIPVK